eukprot:757190-Hanusia_phi.AAC.1
MAPVEYRQRCIRSQVEVQLLRASEGQLVADQTGKTTWGARKQTRRQSKHGIGMAFNKVTCAHGANKGQQSPRHCTCSFLITLILFKVKSILAFCGPDAVSLAMQRGQARDFNL